MLVLLSAAAIILFAAWIVGMSTHDETEERKAVHEAYKELERSRKK